MLLHRDNNMKLNAPTNQIIYTIEEMQKISNMLKNIRTRSKNADNIDNIIAVNDLADFMGLKLSDN